MQFQVLVVRNNGSPVGQTIIDSKYDSVNGVPVDTVQLAEAYADEYLKGKDEYVMVYKL